MLGTSWAKLASASALVFDSLSSISRFVSKAKLSSGIQANLNIDTGGNYILTGQ